VENAKALCRGLVPTRFRRGNQRKHHATNLRTVPMTSTTEKIKLPVIAHRIPRKLKSPP